MKHWNDHSIVKSGSSAECHTFSVNRGLVNTYVQTGELSEDVIDQALLRVVLFKLDKLLPISLYQNIDIQHHQQIALQSAESGVSWIRGGVDLKDKQLYVMNATPPESYHNLINPRGIGPNQSQSAYEVFTQALSSTLLNWKQVSLETLPSDIHDHYLVVVTENHPLPGEDFDQIQAQQLVQQLSQDFEQLIVVGLRSPYDLLHYPHVHHYLCSHSPRPESAIAAAKVLAGEVGGAKGHAVSLVN